MIKRLAALIKKPAFTGTFFVILGTFIGSVFSYLLQIGLGHLLTIENFGVFNAFLSLLAIFSIPVGAISAALIKKASYLLAKNDFYMIRKLFWSFCKSSIIFGLINAALFVFLKEQISWYLKVNEPKLILVFSGVLATSFINTAPVAYLQGLLRFKAFAFVSVFSQFLRFAIPMILVYLGYGVSGAYGGLILVTILTFIISYFFLKKNLWAKSPNSNTKSNNLKTIYKELLISSVPILLTNLGIVMINNVDVIMVKHLFSPYQAGIYAGLVTMCKVFLFGASVIQTAMFPQIAHLYESGANYKSRFLKFLFLQTLVVLAGFLVFAIFPWLINYLMFGGKYSDSVPYMPLFAVFISIYIFITFFSMFLLAINKNKIFFIILPTCLVQITLIYTFHHSIFSVIKANILSASLSCLLIIIYVVKSFKNESLNNSPNI